jgi:superfamily II DNA/RNA helicase
MNTISLYTYYIYDKYKDLKTTGKDIFNNNDLWKIFEWYSAITLHKETNKVFYRYEDIDSDFKERNDLTSNDSGIDLCNLTDTIVQCKLREKYLNWSDCATFFGSQNIFSDELKKTIIKWPNLIITRNLDSKLSTNLSQRSSLFKDKVLDIPAMLHFCEELYNNPPEIPQPIEKIELRYYQKECIDLIKNNGNVCICIPTGTGKNIIIMHSIELNKKYLILVPTIVLMDQLKDEIIKHFPHLNSKIQLIGNSKRSFKENINITICVFNSVHLVEKYKYDKIFIDEAHHIYKPEIYIQQDEEENDNDETEELEINPSLENETYMDKIRKLKEQNNNVYLSATIDPIDGFVNYKKDIRDMINQGYLCDYDIHIPIFSAGPTDKTVCYHLIQNYKHIIVYCEDRKRGQYINKLLNELQCNCSSYIDCNTTKSERAKIIEQYKSGEIPFLVNVKVLVEGFDAPITKGVCLMHLPSSSTTIIQIIGRCLRLHPLKIKANIILPFSQDNEEKSINIFLKTLARNDRRIRKSYETKTIGGYINLYNIKEDNEYNDQEIGILKYNMIFDSLGQCKNSDEIWEEKLSSLKEFIDINKIRPSSTSENNDEKKLGKWVGTNKQSHKDKNRGMQDGTYRRKKWEEFEKQYKKYMMDLDEKWKENLNSVKQFLNNNKKRPSTVSKIEHEKRLGYWLLTNKKDYRNQECGMKDPERRKQWDEFVEQYKRYIMTKEEIWQENLNSVKQFLNNNKRRPSSKCGINQYEKRLGRWLEDNKKDYINQECGMKDPERRKQWDEFVEQYKRYIMTKEEIWQENLNSVKQFLNNNKRRPNSKSKKKHERSLGEWLIDRTCNYKKQKEGMKDPERRKKWEEFINDYKEYI